MLNLRNDGSTYRRQCRELRLRIHAFRVLLHHNPKLQCCKFAVPDDISILNELSLVSDRLHVNHRSNTNKLNILMLLQDVREDVGDQVYTFLVTPSAYEHEKLSSGVNFKTSPLLSLST